MSSSARHSAIVLTLRKAASRAPIVIKEIAWLTRRNGDTSTAWRRTVPADPIRVLSSRGPQLTIASMAICSGFVSVVMWIYCFGRKRERLVSWSYWERVVDDVMIGCLWEQRKKEEVRTISKAWATMRTAISFLPLLRPFIINELVRRSMIGHCALRNRLAAYLPAEWEM